MFTGFDVKYPVYEVHTPQTNLKYYLRSINVQEEEKLKGSLISAIKINDHLNKCIYDAMVERPSHITTFDLFLKNTTLRDRDALLYGLYHITYEEIRNYDVLCGTCTKKYPVTVQASSTFSMDVYPEDDILKKEVVVDLPLSTGVTATIYQPTLFDEANVLRTHGSRIGSNLDILTETLVIKKFQQNPESGDTIIYSEREDIIDAYLSLPSKDKREIYKKYREAFGKYGISLKMLSTCIHCGTQEEVDIDLVENFFRMVHSD